MAGDAPDALDDGVVDGRFAQPPPPADGSREWEKTGGEGLERHLAPGDELIRLAQLESRLRSLGVGLPPAQKLGGATTTAKPSPKPAETLAPAKRPANEPPAPGAGSGGKASSKEKLAKGKKSEAKKRDKAKRKGGSKNQAYDRRADGSAGADEDEDMKKELDELGELEESKRGKDQVAQAQSESMSVGERCEAVCELAEAICALESRICELAEGNPDDEQYAEACERASEDCRVAGDACGACSRE
jgi:hypothetical protein